MLPTPLMEIHSKSHMLSFVWGTNKTMEQGRLDHLHQKLGRRLMTRLESGEGLLLWDSKDNGLFDGLHWKKTDLFS